jgi:hypothetical protein
LTEQSWNILHKYGHTGPVEKDIGVGRRIIGSGIESGKIFFTHNKQRYSLYLTENLQSGPAYQVDHNGVNVQIRNLSKKDSQEKTLFSFTGEEVKIFGEPVTLLDIRQVAESLSEIEKAFQKQT